MNDAFQFQPSWAMKSPSLKYSFSVFYPFKLLANLPPLYGGLEQLLLLHFTYVVYSCLSEDRTRFTLPAGLGFTEQAFHLCPNMNLPFWGNYSRCTSENSSISYGLELLISLLLASLVELYQCIDSFVSQFHLQSEFQRKLGFERWCQTAPSASTKSVTKRACQNWPMPSLT